MKIIAVPAMLMTAAGIIAAWWWPSSLVVKQLPRATVAAPLPAPSANQTPTAHSPQPSVAAEPAVAAAPEQPPADGLPALDPEAIASLRAARVAGEARAPKLSPTVVRDAPSAQAMQHHDAYLAYEQRQDKQLKRAYVEASAVKTRELQGWIEKGRQHGISNEQIAQAQRKLEGIQAMAAELQQQHPDLLNDEFRPQHSPWLQTTTAQ